MTVIYYTCCISLNKGRLLHSSNGCTDGIGPFDLIPAQSVEYNKGKAYQGYD